MFSLNNKNEEAASAAWVGGLSSIVRVLLDYIWVAVLISNIVLVQTSLKRAITVVA